MEKSKRLYNALLNFSQDCITRLGGGRIDASAWDINVSDFNLGKVFEVWQDNGIWIRTERASAFFLPLLDTQTIYRIAFYLDLVADRSEYQRTH